MKVLRSGQWYRGRRAGAAIRDRYAKLLGAKRCLATASGTTALMVSLHVMDVDAGDEVIVSPYTFIATYNAILMHKALPVFADTDPATLTIDPASIESRITDRTRAILPVHIYGMPCDMDPINAIAKKHSLGVVEDACQAWLAEYKGRKCGTLGDLGCFSFQNSKHLPSGEGGAITGNSDEPVDRCHAFHNCGRPRGLQGQWPSSRAAATSACSTSRRPCCCNRSTSWSRKRRSAQQNADYLAAQLKEIPGITPARLPENSRAVWHLYPFRYDAEQFQRAVARAVHPGACGPKGFPCSAGYHEQYFDGLLDEASLARLPAPVQRGAAEGLSRQLPRAERQPPGLRDDGRGDAKPAPGRTRRTSTSIAEAIRKIQAHAGELAKT